MLYSNNPYVTVHRIYLVSYLLPKIFNSHISFAYAINMYGAAVCYWPFGKEGLDAKLIFRQLIKQWIMDALALKLFFIWKSSIAH